MWELLPSDEFTRKQRRWPKKYRRELAAVLRNLNTVHQSLVAGATVESVRAFGFVHAEPRGVLALDQSGGGAGLKQVRLYVYPHETARTLYVLTIGDKASRSRKDIPFCTQFVDDLRRNLNEGIDSNG